MGIEIVRECVRESVCVRVCLKESERVRKACWAKLGREIKVESRCV